MKPKFKPGDEVHYVKVPDVECVVLSSHIETCCGGVQICYMVRPVNRAVRAYEQGSIAKDQFRIFEFELAKGWKKIEKPPERFSDRVKKTVMPVKKEKVKKNKNP